MRGLADISRAHLQGHPAAAIPLSVYLFIERYLCRITHPQRHSYPAHMLGLLTQAATHTVLQEDD